MSTARRIVEEVLALNGGDPFRPVSRERLRQLTDGRYCGAGANGALFGRPAPWMERGSGDQRLISRFGRRRLGR